MAVVYGATDRLDADRPVAINVLRPLDGPAPAFRARFDREAEAIATLDSPYLVRLLDYLLLDDTVPALVMERVDGQTLSNHLATGPVSLATAVDILAQVSLGLTACHDRGLVHGDLKPDNLVIADDAAGCRVRIVDFGLAQLVSDGDELSFPGHVFGSPLFMAPEQWLETGLDPRTDIYAPGLRCCPFSSSSRRPGGGRSVSPQRTSAPARCDSPTTGSLSPTANRPRRVE